ncbi:TetR/AcrR family transcriptional regulator [Streptomyces globisporus]|uniref:TetR/AcrR family transcriptional regulator n=1 Tax=Streptomyces globisporus TaxID=1908 RepID=A0A423V2G5_STRGL|nr:MULTISPECIES: TetR/AcrR family transcriptional regulator [Streptomyces]ROV68747.1 TetR/AcrR family transcriptional regulator [Streptomyces globisporus]
MTEPRTPSSTPARTTPVGPADLALPSAGGTTRLRADAARNRSRLLEVADRLAAAHGIENVTMDDIASGAGVGKGTVFRRFGDRVGLMAELLSHHEERLQEGFLSGPPPLGPGARPDERMRAFGLAVIRHEHAHRDLYLAAHRDLDRRRTGPSYQLRLAHLCMLLREVRPDSDTELVAHTLLGYLETVLVDHLLTRRGMSPERVEAGWCDLVDRYSGRCTGRCID